MSERSWRISVYDLKAGMTCLVPLDGLSFFFVPAGEVDVSGNGQTRKIATGHGEFLASGETVAASEGAWLFQAGSGPDLHRDEALLPVLSRLTPPMSGPVIARVDRIDQPAGMRTPSHHHRGPGIRRLMHGLLLAEVGDHTDLIRPGQAWFESGREPVIGTNLTESDNVFVRMMLLPAELEGGKSSFVPTTAADAARPRGVTPHVFGERPV